MDRYSKRATVRRVARVETGYDENGRRKGRGNQMTRRPRGEGSLFQNSAGVWIARCDLGFDETGHRRRWEARCQTKTEALRRLHEVQAKAKQGFKPGPERLTLGQHLEDWLENTVKVSVRGRTFESYCQIVRGHLTPGLGKARLTNITPQDVQKYLTQKHKGGLSARSVQYHRAILRGALNQALKWGLVARNVAALADPPRVRQREVQPLTLDQARVFLEAARGDRLEALYTTALSLGLRQGECLGLHWQDVDFDAGRLEVRTTLQRIGGKLQLVEPKTERSRRRLSLPAFAVAALREHRVRQLQERLQAGSLWVDSGLVFTTHFGGPIAKENLRRPWARLLRDAKLPPIRFHDLRHSAASLLHAQGADARLIMGVLGHSQISTTMNVYAHIFEEAKQEAAVRMDAALGKTEAVG